MYADLSTRTALVTGAAKGIGKATALAFARQGASLALLDRDAEALADVAEACRAASPQERAMHTFVVDLMDHQATAHAVRSAIDKLNELNVVVNVAGITSPARDPFEGIAPQDWERVFSTNVTSIFVIVKEARRALIGDKDGRIINISSLTASRSLDYLPAYTTSKAAVNSFTRVLARQFAPFGTTVNAISPGFIRTPLWDERSDEFDSRIDKWVPMGRPQSADDVAWLSVFLASPLASNITGQIIGVDGGASI